MAIPINSIVNVSITRQTQAISQAGFGVPLIFGFHSYFAERIKTVSSLTELAALGFLTSDTIYKMASAIFAQNPKPSSIAIGRKAANVQGVLTIDFSVDFITGNVINLKVLGTAISPVTFATSHAVTAGLVKTAIEAISGVASAVVTGNDIAVTFASGIDGSISDVVVTGGASQPTSTIITTTAAVTYGSELNLLVVESEDWYALLIDSTSDNDILSSAAWIQSHTPAKIFGARTSAAAIITSATTDIASVLQGKGYDRTFAAYHNVANEYLAASILGKMLPKNPGSATYKFKTVTGVTADALTTSQLGYAEAKNCNTYTSVGGVSIFSQGKMASGEYIDVIIGLDWLTARIQERVYGKLVQLEKVPFTDAGVGIIENEIKAQLRAAITQGVLAASPEPTTSVPLVANVSTNDKANRLLPSVTFGGTLAGAIHKTTVAGTVTV